MKTLSIIAALLLFPAALAANPVPAFYISEFSTGEDWIEIMCYFYDITFDKGITFTVNSDTVTVTKDLKPTSYEQPFVVLNQENTSGFDLPEAGGEINSRDLSVHVRYGGGEYCPPPSHGTSAAFHLIQPPYWTESSPQSYWSLDLTPTPGERNDHEMAAYGEGSVFINEYSPGGEAAGDTPFIELFNNGDDAVDIGGWRLLAAQVYEIPSGTVIESRGFHVIDTSALPESFFAAHESGSLCLVNGYEALVDRVYWTEALEEGETLCRYPDGFVNGFTGYRNYLSLDFRAGERTVGATNRTVYEVASIALESDSLFVSPGADQRAYCRATDSSGKTFRIKPEWSLDGDCATIDENGFLVYLKGGDGILSASYGGFRDEMKIHCAVGEKITRDTTWSAAGSPYMLERYVIIDEGVTVTVEPGTKIVGNPDVNITCGGRFIAEGTESAPIVLSANNNRVYLQLYGEPSTIRYCDFSNCITFLTLSGKDTEKTGSRNELSYCRIRTEYNGVRIYSDTVVSHCIIHGSSGDPGDGIYLNNSKNNEIINCVITGCNTGIRNLESSTRIINNIIISSSTGIKILGETTCDICYNCMYGVDILFLGVAPEYGDMTESNANGHPCDKYYNIYASPWFVDNIHDYRLKPNSHCIDAGDPSLRDADGSVSDMGVYGGGYAVGIEDTEEEPAVFALSQNHPNPFNPATAISYTIPKDTRVTVTIHNIAGQRVTALVDDRQAAGRHSVVWDAADMPSGIYFCTIRAGSMQATRKMLLLK